MTIHGRLLWSIPEPSPTKCRHSCSVPLLLSNLHQSVNGVNRKCIFSTHFKHPLDLLICQLSKLFLLSSSMAFLIAFVLMLTSTIDLLYKCTLKVVFNHSNLSKVMLKSYIFQGFFSSMHKGSDVDSKLKKGHGIKT